MVKVIEKLRTKVNKIIRSLRWKIEYLRERLEGFIGIYRVDTKHIYTQEENALIEQSVKEVKKFFPEPPGKTLIKEDFQSRCDAIEEFADRLTKVYGMKDVEIIITDDTDIFPQDGTLYFGSTRMQERIVYINANLLLLEDEDILGHLIGTVIHELRHIMQYEIMTLVNTRGVPYQRRKAWRHATVNYINSEYDMEGYMQQSIEFDARNFTNRIWRGVYKRNIPLGGNGYV